jgi:hypothetical protein
VALTPRRKDGEETKIIVKHQNDEEKIPILLSL